MTTFFYCHSHERGNPGGDARNALSLRWERAGVRVTMRTQAGGDLMEVYQLGLKRTTTMSPS